MPCSWHAQIVERQLNVRDAEALVQNIPRADQDGGPGTYRLS